MIFEMTFFVDFLKEKWGRVKLINGVAEKSCQSDNGFGNSYEVSCGDIMATGLDLKNKKSVTTRFYWSQRAESNRRPAHYE